MPLSLCRKKVVLCTILMLCVAVAYASDPRPVPGTPPVWVPAPPDETNTPGVPNPNARANVAGMLVRPVSTVFFPTNRTKSVVSLHSTGLPDLNLLSLLSHPPATRRLYVNPDALPYSPGITNFDMANDGYIDREPVVSSITLGSGSLYPGTYTFGAWIRSVTSNNTRIVWSRTTDFTGGSTTAPAYVGMPAGYTDSGDPVLAENPQTYGSAPDRTFIAGLTFNRDLSGHGVGPSSVRVWGADNADFPYSPPNDAWSATGSEVASRPAFTTDQQLMLDKPWMDVSWYTSTQGYAYVVYTEENLLNRLMDRILFKESPTGVSPRCRPAGGGCGDAWSAEYVVAGGTGNSYVGEPQVVVNSNNGDVYVLWVDTYDYYIKMRTWNESTQSFGSVQYVAYVPNYEFGNGDNNKVLATIPCVRFNSVSNKIMVIWHAKDGTSESMYYTVATPGSNFVTPVRLRPESADLLAPTIDNDSSGNTLIGYYARSGANYPSYFGTYHQSVLTIDPASGVVISGPFILNGTDASYFDLGDYQGLWRWTYPDGAFFTSSWIARPSFSTYPDTYLSRIQ